MTYCRRNVVVPINRPPVPIDTFPNPPTCEHVAMPSSSAAYSPPAARPIYRARLPLPLHTRRVFTHHACTTRPRAPALPPVSPRARGGRDDHKTVHAESHACVAAARDARQAEILLSAFPSAPHLCLSSNTDAFDALKASLKFRGSSARPALYVGVEARAQRASPGTPTPSMPPPTCPGMPPRDLSPHLDTAHRLHLDCVQSTIHTPQLIPLGGARAMHVAHRCILRFHVRHVM